MGQVYISASDLTRDPGLETAILISIFTDKRADDIDVLPNGETDKRGWWADTSNYKMGSKLWLIMASKTTPDVYNKVKQYILDSLSWMLEDGLATAVDAEVSRSEDDAYTLLIKVNVTEPSGTQRFYKYSFNWEAEEIKRSE